MGRHILFGRRNRRLLGIVSRFEDAFLQLLIAFAHFILLALQQVFQFVEIFVDRVGKISEFEGQQVGIC